MALGYLVDTNIISETENLQAADKNVTVKLQEHWDELALSAISWHEILYGYHCLPTSKRKQRVRFFIENTLEPNIPILPYDAAAAEWFATERARLSRLGRPPAYADGQIAAIAAVNNLTLVTRNVQDFADFANLRIENWFDA
ncbi:MAG: type II toxin-antitoxin system VapC family toxin [Ardenticatenaceae bacterium]|nr:type II toxin-antitoxin system VapC family toxin [Ardenticatenaceae bacterium]